MNTYIVRIKGAKNTWKVRARTPQGALNLVWKDIKHGFTYGCDNRRDFLNKATAERQ